eukprot:1000727-Alexandrium_andersonii.AAC.1
MALGATARDKSGVDYHLIKGVLGRRAGCHALCPESGFDVQDLDLLSESRYGLLSMSGIIPFKLWI